MLSTLFRYILLPIVILVLLAYGALPWWLPLAAKQSQSYTGIDFQDLAVSYPLHNKWQIQNLQANYANDQQRTQVQAEHIELTYDVMDLWQGGMPNLNIAKVSFDSKLAQSSVDSAPILLLLPQRWLQQIPEQLNIGRIDGTVSSPDTALGQSFAVAGKFNATPEQAHAVAKITTDKDQNLFFEAQFADDNAISATLFTKQQSAPIAKLTSQMRDADSELNWQGQMALNVPVMQKLLASLIPQRFALPIEQGRLMSHWQINVPKDQQQSLQQWLQAAYGEHQFQLQIQTNSKLAKSIDLDANVTHYLGKNTPDQWQINAGSQLSLIPNWNNFNLQPSTINSLALDQMEMRVVAQGPVDLSLETEAKSLFSTQETLVFGGVLNATMQSANSQYQIFTQLKDLRYNNTDAWRGQADLSGYYVLPKDHQLLKQIPLGIKQVQAIAHLDFAMTPDSWQIELAPNSKLSANQVESQLQKNQVLLFASDRLNLVNKESLQLTYHTADNQWQWNNLNLSLHPQTSTGTEQAKSRELGLQIQLPAGRSQFSNRPSQGFFQLHARDTRLRGWPEFDLLGDGGFTFGGNHLALDFTGQAQPFSPLLKGEFSWDFAAQTGSLTSKATDIDLNALQNQHSINWPMQVDTGSVDYQGNWRWKTAPTKEFEYNHAFQLHSISGTNESFSVEGLSGSINIQPSLDSLISNYRLRFQTLQPASYVSALGLDQVQARLQTTSPLGKGLAKAMTAPEQWQLESLKSNFLGGSLVFQNDEWLLKAINMDTLSQTLWPQLQATGKLTGSMVLDNQWQIDSLKATTTGAAQLHLKQPLEPDLPGAETFNQLLQNMQVSKLEIVSQSSIDNHLLPVNLRLQGQTEQFNNGEPVDLNLTVNANLESLTTP